MISRWLAHPLTVGLDLDDPQTTALRRQIIRSKPFLHSVYDEWYRLLVDRLPEGAGMVLELGSGGGFLDEYIPNLITSDVLPVPGVAKIVDGRSIPFADDSLRAIVMTNVLHHIPEVDLFLFEAQRSLRPGGRVEMIEPWNTGWSRFVHKRFHHEPMLPHVKDWTLPASGPLSVANAALPWIVTVRDRDRLERDWRGLQVVEITPFMPFRYLLSGGVSMRSLQPGWAFNAWSAFERLPGLARSMAVFALIVLERR